MSLLTDLRYALRSLARVKGLTFTVIVTLALLIEFLPLPAIAKFLLLVLSGTIMSFGLAWLVRKIPLVRNVV